MTLTVAVQTRDATEGYAPSAISAFHEFADEVVIHEDPEGEMWGDETRFRQSLWEAAVSRNTDWIMVLDDDMVPLKDPRPLMREGVDAIAFRLYDLWSTSPYTYREDGFWQAHLYPRVWAVQNPGELSSLSWNPRGIHTGHFPQGLPFRRVITAPRDFSLLHYAYSTLENRQAKSSAYFKQYQNLTPRELDHAESILDIHPHVVKLPYEPLWHLTKSES